MEMIREAKIYYALQLKDIGRHMQLIINSLSFDNLNEVVNKINDMLDSENQEILEGLEVFKNLKN